MCLSVCLSVCLFALGLGRSWSDTVEKQVLTSDTDFSGISSPPLLVFIWKWILSRAMSMICVAENPLAPHVVDSMCIVQIFTRELMVLAFVLTVSSNLNVHLPFISKATQPHLLPRLNLSSGTWPKGCNERNQRGCVVYDHHKMHSVKLSQKTNSL